jgi:hypothetical protein
MQREMPRPQGDRNFFRTILREPTTFAASSRQSVRGSAGLGTVMIVNLNRYRKLRERSEDRRDAAVNRVRFGRTKQDRANEQRQTERAKKAIEAKRLE